MVRKILTIFLTCFALNACSVFMAATGSDEVDLNQIHVGAHRTTVESLLGKPIVFYRRGGADFAVYQILTNDKADYNRAVANAALVGLTLGLAEFVTFPTEALQGDQNRFEILYSPNGKVLSYRHILNEAPLPNPTEVLQKKLKENQMI